MSIEKRTSSGSLPISVAEIVRVQTESVARWHEQATDNPRDGFLGQVCTQHQFNYNLWHEEDKARSATATDAEIANVKRSIDRLNQSRNDWIEKLDDFITELLADVTVSAGARLATETPGSAIDRLSIMSLRIYHYREDLDRTDTTAEHKQRTQQRLGLCLKQQSDLAQSLQQLIDDQFAGRMRHQTYRQMKMYNDPTLNPELYKR